MKGMKKPPNRQARRADPDQWYRVSAYFDPEEEKVVEVTGTGPDGTGAVCIKGSVDNVIVVQVPDMPPHKQVEIFKGVQATMQQAGVDKPVILIPHWARIVRFQKLDRETNKKLNRQARINAIKAGATKH